MEGTGGQRVTNWERQGREERRADRQTPDPSVAVAAPACHPKSLPLTLIPSPQRMGHREAALQADALIHQQLPEEPRGAAQGLPGGARRCGALHGGVEPGFGKPNLFSCSEAEREDQAPPIALRLPPWGNCRDTEV